MKPSQILQAAAQAGVAGVLAVGNTASHACPYYAQLPNEASRSLPMIFITEPAVLAAAEYQTVASEKTRASDALTENFNSLVNQWRLETKHFSVIARRYENPAYKAILDMQAPAIPLILQELRRDPDRWFAALEKLTGENPAKDAINFYEAVDRWIAW